MLRIVGPRQKNGRLEYAAQIDTRMGPLLLRASVSPQLVEWLRRNVRVDSMGGGCQCSGRDPSGGAVPEILERVAVGAAQLAEDTHDDALAAWHVASVAMLNAAGCVDDFGPSFPGPWLYAATSLDTPPVLSFHVDRWRMDPGELVPDVIAGCVDALSGQPWVEARPGTSDILAALGMAGM